MFCRRCGQSGLVRVCSGHWLSTTVPHCFLAFLITVILCQSRLDSKAQSGTALGFDPYLTISGNFDFGFQATQFYAPHQDAVVGDWDTRVELWLPPYRTNFSWAPYLRFAGIDSSKGATGSWFDNALLSAPGAGFQLYPFSLPYFRETNRTLGDIFGPVRLFGEYNRVDYWGTANTWRPTDQIRAGMEYWRARNVNDTRKPLWNEIWTGLYYQSANDFSRNYDTAVFANSLRFGARVPRQGFISTLSPYVVVESSFTGHPSYFWENRLLLGAGLRFTPPLRYLPDGMGWLNRVVLFAEYLNTASYYYGSPSASVPHYDVQAGLSFSIGEWYH